MLIREVLPETPNGALEQLMRLESRAKIEPDPLGQLNKIGETCEWKEVARGTRKLCKERLTGPAMEGL